MISNTLIINVGILISCLAIIYSISRMAKMSNVKTFEFNRLVKVIILIILMLALGIPYYLSVLNQETELHLEEIKVLNKKLKDLKEENKALKDLLKNTSNEDEIKKIKELIQENEKLQQEIISLKKTKNKNMISHEEAINSYKEDIRRLKQSNLRFDIQELKIKELEAFYKSREDSLIQVFKLKLEEQQQSIQDLKNLSPQTKEQNNDEGEFARKYNLEVEKVLLKNFEIKTLTLKNEKLEDELFDLKNIVVTDYQDFAENLLDLMPKLDRGDPLTLKECGKNISYYLCKAIDVEKIESKDLEIRRKHKEIWKRYKNYIPTPFCK